MWAVLRVLLALAALGVAYHGQMLLEGRAYIGLGVRYFAVAAVMLIVADLGRHRARTAEPPSGATARQTTLGWWALLLVAFGLGCFYRFHQLGLIGDTVAPWGVWFD